MTPRIPILLYHQVLSLVGDAGPRDSVRTRRRRVVDVEQFRTDMVRLHRQNWRCVSPVRAARLNLAGRRSPRTFALTFDDGTRDYAEHVHPILQDLGFTAMLFVVTGRLGERADWGGAGDELLGAEELRGLVGEGVELGSHSHTHPHLPRCSDEKLRDELRTSREVLSELCGKRVEATAWPYGAHDERSRKIAAESGYALGFAVAGDGPLLDRVRRAMSPGARDPLAVPRREVHGGEFIFRRRLRMGPADGLLVTARKLSSLVNSP